MFGDAGARTRSTTSSTTGPRSGGPRGGPTAIHAPGTLVQFGPAIRRPFGRVHWAGTETSTYWTRLHGRRGPRRRAGCDRGAATGCEAAARRALCGCRARPRLGTRRDRGAGHRDDGETRSSHSCRRRASRRTSTRTPTAGSTPARYVDSGEHAARGCSSGAGDGTLLRSWTVPGPGARRATTGSRWRTRPAAADWFSSRRRRRRS